MAESENPHLSIPPVHAGADLTHARALAVLIHGRNQDDDVMLDVVNRLALSDIAYVLPVAADRSWYPNRYYDPVADVEPHLQLALTAVQNTIETAATEAPQARLIVGGFSQGACLVADLVARQPPARLAGVAVLTGSLIGRVGERRIPTGVDGLPMFFSCAREDEWVALADAEYSARAFQRAGGRVIFEPLDDRDHVISDAAVAGLHALLTASD